jgi:hypothetical protein
MTILIAIMLLYGKPVATTAEFSTPQACEAARVVLLKAASDFAGGWVSTAIRCVPK